MNLRIFALLTIIHNEVLLWIDSRQVAQFVVEEETCKLSSFLKMQMKRKF